VTQLALDYSNGPWRFGYAGLAAKPASTAKYDNQVQYHNLYANWDYGHGKVYLAYVRSNNVTSGFTPCRASATAAETSSPNGPRWRRSTAGRPPALRRLR
jgi:hypothetical protein